LFKAIRGSALSLLSRWNKICIEKIKVKSLNNLSGPLLNAQNDLSDLNDNKEPKEQNDANPPITKAGLKQ
jgi:hypothetical protein